MHQSEGGGPIPGPVRTVGLPSADLTLGHDQGLDQDHGQGLTLIRPADPALVPAPTVGPINVHLILGEMDAALDIQGPGLGLVRDLMGTGALAHHGPLCLTVEGLGKVEMELGPTGLDLDLAHLVATGVEALVDENHLFGNWHPMS